VGGLPRGCCGIRNQGNTCYQNSALQLLACVPELVGVLLGPQAAQLFQEAAADAAQQLGRRSRVTRALAAAAAAAQEGIDWRPGAAVGPALQALVGEMWGFQQDTQASRQQRGSPSQTVQRSLQHQQQLQRVTQCMAELRCAMAESDPRWDDGDQWDCQEFCLALLQTVHVSDGCGS
jgi:ubiquitin C-terminal hydrolase